MLRTHFVRRLPADRDAARGRHWHLVSGVPGTRIAGHGDAPLRSRHSVAPTCRSRRRRRRSLQPLKVPATTPLTTSVAKNARHDTKRHDNKRGDRRCNEQQAPGPPLESTPH